MKAAAARHRKRVEKAAISEMATAAKRVLRPSARRHACVSARRPERNGDSAASAAAIVSRRRANSGERMACGHQTATKINSAKLNVYNRAAASRRRHKASAPSGGWRRKCRRGEKKGMKAWRRHAAKKAAA